MWATLTARRPGCEPHSGVLVGRDTDHLWGQAWRRALSVIAPQQGQGLAERHSDGGYRSSRLVQGAAPGAGPLWQGLASA